MKMRGAGAAIGECAIRARGRKDKWVERGRGGMEKRNGSNFQEAVIVVEAGEGEFEIAN